MYHSSFSCRVGDIHIAHKYAKKIKASVHPNATGDPRYLPELEGFAVGVPVMENRGVIRPSKFVVTAVFNDPSPFVIAVRSMHRITTYGIQFPYLDSLGLRSGFTERPDPNRRADGYNFHPAKNMKLHKTFLDKNKQLLP